MKVAQVDFVSIASRDVSRSVAWYRDVLGLTESDYNNGEVETANVTLGFWNPESDGEPFVPNPAGIGLRVGDVHAAVAEAEQAGAEVIGIEDTGVCHMGFVKDPDGNVADPAPQVRAEGAEASWRELSCSGATRRCRFPTRRRRRGASRTCAASTPTRSRFRTAHA